MPSMPPPHATSFHKPFVPNLTRGARSLVGSFQPDSCSGSFQEGGCSMVDHVATCAPFSSSTIARACRRFCATLGAACPSPWRPSFSSSLPFLSCPDWQTYDFRHQACALVRTSATLCEPSVEVAPSVWFGSVHVEVNLRGLQDVSEKPTFARSAFHNQVDSAFVGGGSVSDTRQTQVAHLSAQVRPKRPTLASRLPQAT